MWLLAPVKISGTRPGAGQRYRSSPKARRKSCVGDLGFGLLRVLAGRAEVGVGVRVLRRGPGYEPGLGEVGEGLVDGGAAAVGDIAQSCPETDHTQLKIENPFSPQHETGSVGPG